MTSSRRVVLAASAALAAIVAAPSLAAYICHPDPAGTRTLALSGTVERYLVAGPKVSVAVRTQHGCRVVAWNVLTGAHRTTSGMCLSLLTRDLSVSGGLRTAVEPASATRPDTLEVFRGMRRIASWPLPAKPRTLHKAAGYALFTAADGGTYALRLADGRIAGLGPAAAGDDPQISAVGAVFAPRPGYSTARATSLKFVPLAGIAHEVNMNARPLRTGGAVTSFAMDGPRVALTVRDATGRCDRVLYWNVLRAPVQRISTPVGPTCVPGRATGISSVAIGGFRAEWLARSGDRASIVVGSPQCQEWVVRRLAAGHPGESVVAMAADGGTLAFALTDHQRELRGLGSVGVVVGKYSVRTILSGRIQPVALAVNGSVVATALADGTVDVRTAAGRRIAWLDVGSARAIALGDGKLAVLRVAALDVFSLKTGKRIRSVDLPSGTQSTLDVDYGIAVVAAGRNVFAVDLGTGRVAVVGTTRTPIVAAAIESAGIAYAATSAGRGSATFVPLTRVETLLAR